MKLPSFKRINKTDFDEEDRKLIDKLSFLLNNPIETLFQLVNKRISLADNINSNIKTVVVRCTNSDGTLQSQPELVIDFIKDFPILGLDLKRAESNTIPKVYPTSGIHVSFDVTTTGIKITNVVGLPVGVDFTLTLVIWAT